MILKNLASVPHDKLLHIVAGLAATMKTAKPAWALAAAVIVGGLKELYDLWQRHKHTPDPWDALATAAGGAAGFFCTYF